MKLETIDLYQCHRYDSETPLEETLTALHRAVQSGKVRTIGFSEWTAEQVSSAMNLAGAGILTPLACNQSQYSILWRKPELSALKLCSEHGIGFLAFTPLAHGALSGKYTAGKRPPRDSRAANAEMGKFMETAGRNYRSDHVLEAVAQLKPIAADLGMTMAQMSLAWVLRRQDVTSAIIGASRPEQIAENVKAIGVKLPTEVIEAINHITDDVAVWK